MQTLRPGTNLNDLVSETLEGLCRSAEEVHAHTQIFQGVKMVSRYIKANLQSCQEETEEGKGPPAISFR